MRWLLLILWLLSLGSAWAEELQVRIETNLPKPPSIRQKRDNGMVTKPLSQRETIYRFPEEWLGLGNFTIEENGYQNAAFTLTRDDYENLPPDPVNPGVKLHPKIALSPLSNFWLGNFINNHPYLAMLIAVAGLMGLVVSLRRYSESHRDRQKLEKMARVSESDGDPMVGLRLGDYYLTGKLGSGGMATVYRAVPFDTMAESEAVALKVIQTDISDPDFLPRFYREVQVTASLNHPNTLRLINWGDHEGLFYLVTELVEGAPLRAPAGGMPLTEFHSILPSLSAGMLYAHQRGVVHRDLKPDNLMRMPNGQIKIMDFGMARSHDMKTVTATGTALGTPAYMAPEQILGKPPSFLCDQYALGITFYELLCGRRPFEQEEMVALLRAQLQEEPMPMQMYRPELSMELEQVVMRMLCKEPERRYPDLAEALAELKLAVEDMLK